MTAPAHASAAGPVPRIAPRSPGSERASAGRTDRVFAGISAAALLTLLGVAAWLTPAASGHGTHTGLGLPTCGWLIATGRPCPTCGMTTAFAHAADFSLLDSVVAQPFGAMLALASAVGFWGCLHVAVFGSRLGPMAGRLLRPRVLWVLAGLGLAAWIYKTVAMGSAGV